MERQNVNLYLTTDIKGPAQQEGNYGYVLEMESSAGPITLSNFKKLAEKESENGAVLTSLKESLGRIRKSCRLTLYIDSDYVAAALEKGWLTQWKYNGWMNRKNKLVCDVAKWQDIEYLLSVHEYQVALKQDHPYRSWMDREVRKER